MSCLPCRMSCKMGGKQPYSFYFAGCSFQAVRPYSSIDIATASKDSRFILSQRSDFYMVNNLSMAVYDLPMCMLTSHSVDEILLLNHMN